MSGWKGLRGVLGSAAACGIAFAGTQFFVSNLVGAQLTGILSSLAAILALLIAMRRKARRSHHSGVVVAHAWAPYALLVIFVLLWGYKPLQNQLASFDIPIQWPALHNAIQRMPPVVGSP